nr:DEAD/DEAH box helicase [Saprospiraceae bacterium]
MTFKELKVQDNVLRALDEQGYEKPTPIQQQAIPYLLDGRDIIACAQTGTGKTAAFAIPIIQLLTGNSSQNRGIKSLILTPTRELAIQIEESFKAYGRHTRISHTVVFGGVPQGKQVSALKRGVDVLIATPGRLLDLIGQGHIKLGGLEIFVLDEADRMLDMGFINDVKKVLKLIPKKRQTLLFSATMPDEIKKLSQQMLINPAKVEVTPPASTVDKIEQTLYYTNKSDKRKLLVHLIQEKNIEMALVFNRTKHGADKIVKFLKKSGISASAIHGNKSQNARQKALKDFKDGKVNILVATDIAARGIDIDELTHVFNYDLPNVAETYVHRIGRTGRAGNEGTAIAFCDAGEKGDLKDIQKLIDLKIKVVEDHPFPLTDSAPEKKSQPQGRRSGGGRGGNHRGRRR